MKKFADSQKDGNAKKSSRKPASGKKSSSKTSSFSLWKFLRSDKMIVFYGVLLCLFALLLFLSIISFYFNAHESVSYMVGNRAQEAPNLAKGVGTALSYFFVQFFFGVASIGFPFLILIYGIRLVTGKSLLPLGLTTFTTIMTMAWVSITLGLFTFNSDKSFLGGQFGNFIAQFLVEHVGWVFTILIVIALLLLLLLFCYNISFVNLLERIQQWAVNKREMRAERRREKFTQTIPISGFQREDLPDMYTSNHGELSEEYAPKNYDLVDNKEAENEEFVADDLQTSEENLLEEDPFTPSQDIPFEIVNTQTKDIGEGIDEDNDNVKEDDNDDDDFEIITDFGGEEPGHATTPEEVHELEPYDPTKELSRFEFPPVDLLKDYPFTASTAELIKKELFENKMSIEKTLLSFGIAIKSISAVVGPTVTLYEIVPKEGVRISKIKNLEDDIALSLAALGIRIIAPIPGRGTIGIEVPNKNPNIVSMREIITSEKFKKNNYALPIGLGKTINNEAK